MPMGLFTYPGAIQSCRSIAGTYYQWPIYEGLMWGGVQAGSVRLRYFTDDRGRTFVERGLERVQGGFVKQQFTRFLAIFAACSCSSSCSTTFPPSGSACTPSPGRRTSRSARISMGICGEGTDVPVPDPALPIPGELRLHQPRRPAGTPAGAELPKTVPFEQGNEMLTNSHSAVPRQRRSTGRSARRWRCFVRRRAAVCRCC